MRSKRLFDPTKAHDQLLIVLAILANLWLALDSAGIARRLLPDASTRAMQDYRRTKKEEPSVLRKRDAVIRELQERHPWAGKYFGRHGETLSVAPGLGYRSEWINYFASKVTDRGDLAFQPTLLLLTSATRDDAPIAERIVPWGRRVYLIREDEFIDFANAVNKGKEPRKSQYGDFLLREGDWSKPVSGLPLVPASDRARFPASPIVASIVRTGALRIRPAISSIPEERVVLNAGRAQGLMPDMHLYPLEKDRWFEFDVLSVSANSSVAETAIFGDSAPQEGWRLSTRDDRPPKNLGSGFFEAQLPEPPGWRLPDGYGRDDEE